MMPQPRTYSPEVLEESAPPDEWAGIPVSHSHLPGDPCAEGCPAYTAPPPPEGETDGVG